MPDVDDSYLMGFDLTRGSEAITTKEGAVKESEEPRSVWDFDVFQHLDRLQGESSPRYIKSYDVYSLGVLLLEGGFGTAQNDSPELNTGRTGHLGKGTVRDCSTVRHKDWREIPEPGCMVS